MSLPYWEFEDLIEKLNEKNEKEKKSHDEQNKNLNEQQNSFKPPSFNMPNFSGIMNKFK